MTQANPGIHAIVGQYEPNAVVMATRGSDNAASAANLRLAYAKALTLTPGGNALSWSNRAVVLIPPGTYDFGTGDGSNHGLVLSSSYVDLVGMSDNPEHVVLTSSIETASRGTVELTQGYSRIYNMTIAITGTSTYSSTYTKTDPAAYYDSYGSVTGEPVLTNVVLRSDCDEAPWAMAIGSDVSRAGTYTKVVVTGCYAFGGFGGSLSGIFTDCDTLSDCGWCCSGVSGGTLPGRFTRCTGIGWGAATTGTTGGTLSGTFVDCNMSIQTEAGEAFPKLTGKFDRCVINASNADMDSGTFVNCDLSLIDVSSMNSNLSGCDINITADHCEGSITQCRGYLTITNALSGRIQDCTFNTALIIGSIAVDGSVIGTAGSLTITSVSGQVINCSEAAITEVTASGVVQGSRVVGLQSAATYSKIMLSDVATYTTASLLGSLTHCNIKLTGNDIRLNGDVVGGVFDLDTYTLTVQTGAKLIGCSITASGSVRLQGSVTMANCNILAELIGDKESPATLSLTNSRISDIDTTYITMTDASLSAAFGVSGATGEVKQTLSPFSATFATTASIADADQFAMTHGGTNMLVSASDLKTYIGAGTGSAPVGTSVVTGPSSAIAGNLPQFNGTTGRVLQDSSWSPETMLAFSLALAGDTTDHILTNADCTITEDRVRDIEANLTLAHFRIIANTSLTGVQNYVGGFIDELEGTTQLRGSTGASYSSADNGYLANFVTPVTIDSYDMSNRSSFTATVGATEQVGQAFTASSSVTVTAGKMCLSRTGSPGVVTCKLTRASGTIGTSGSPGTNTAILSTTMASSAIDTSFGMVTFPFGTGAAITSGQAYSLSVHCAGDASNYISVGVDDSTPTHGGNGFVGANLSTTSFTTYSSLDYCFAIQSGSDTPQSAVIIAGTQGAATAPSSMAVCLMYKDAGTSSATLGTDIVAKVITDGSTVGTTMTFDEAYSLGSGYKIAQGYVSMAANTGTAMSLRLDVANKPTEIHAYSLSWR